MKKTVWTFGLISGAIMAALMLATVPLMDRIGFDQSEVIGYTSIVAAFLFVFFGIRSYRERTPGGALSFGRGLLVGVLISVVASACYVATWEAIYYRLAPDFVDKYGAYVVDKARASGASEDAIAERAAQMEKFKQLYRNPLINASITFFEPFWIGLAVSLASAGVLRRRATEASSVAVRSTPQPIG